MRPLQVKKRKIRRNPLAAGQRDDSERRCVLTGESQVAKGLIRMVQGPDGYLVPDIKGKLPGRGLWISSDRALIEKALGDGSFAKAASRALKETIKKDQIPQDLPDMMERLLAKQALSRLGLEKKASHIVSGFEKVRAELRSQKRPLLLVNAIDGAEDGKHKLSALAEAISVKVVEIFDREELSLALGRENVVHLVLLAGGAKSRLIADFERLAGFRSNAVSNDKAGHNDEESL